MSRPFLIAAVFVGLLSVLCFVLFASTEATLDAAGVLHEPFALIPLGWLFAFGCGGLLLLARWGRK